MENLSIVSTLHVIQLDNTYKNMYYMAVNEGGTAVKGEGARIGYMWACWLSSVKASYKKASPLGEYGFYG